VHRCNIQLLAMDSYSVRFDVRLRADEMKFSCNVPSFRSSTYSMYRGTSVGLRTCRQITAECVATIFIQRLWRTSRRTDHTMRLNPLNL